MPDTKREFLGALWPRWKATVTGAYSAPYLLWGLLLSVVLAVLSVELIDNLALKLGAAAALPTLLIVSSVLEAAYTLWRDERGARRDAETKIQQITTPRLEIIFDPADQQFVRPNPIQTQMLYRYFVGICNAGDTTLDGVTLRAQEGEFVENTIARAYAREMDYGLQMDREPIIAEFDHLDPHVTELVELFYNNRYQATFSEPLLHRFHRFSLEARARNTPTQTVEFEYDPHRRPMISVP